MYLTVTRLYISYVVHIDSQFVPSPCSVHFAIVFYILHYMIKMALIFHRLFFPSSTNDLVLCAYFDTEYYFLLGDALISWWVNKQIAVSWSIIEVKYHAWLTPLLNSFGCALFSRTWESLFLELLWFIVINKVLFKFLEMTYSLNRQITYQKKKKKRNRQIKLRGIMRFSLSATAISPISIAAWDSHLFEYVLTCEIVLQFFPPSNFFF